MVYKTFLRVLGTVCSVLYLLTEASCFDETRLKAVEYPHHSQPQPRTQIDDSSDFNCCATEADHAAIHSICVSLECRMIRYTGSNRSTYLQVDRLPEQ
jgi:hypothetical protein